MNTYNYTTLIESVRFDANVTFEQVWGNRQKKKIKRNSSVGNRNHNDSPRKFSSKLLVLLRNAWVSVRYYRIFFSFSFYKKSNSLAVTFPRSRRVLLFSFFFFFTDMFYCAAPLSVFRSIYSARSAVLIVRLACPRARSRLIHFANRFHPPRGK